MFVIIVLKKVCNQHLTSHNFQEPLPAWSSEAYSSSFHVSGTPGKHQWLQSCFFTAAIRFSSVSYHVRYTDGWPSFR